MIGLIGKRRHVPGFHRRWKFRARYRGKNRLQCCDPNKKIDSEGYSSVQISTGTKKENISQNPKKPISINQTLPQQKQLKEFRIQESDLENIELGQSLELNMFEEGQIIDVTVQPKGKALLVRSNVGILQHKMQHTEIL